MNNLKVLLELYKKIRPSDLTIDKKTYTLPSQDIYFHLTKNDPFKSAVLEEGLKESAFGILSFPENVANLETCANSEFEGSAVSFSALGYELTANGKLLIPAGHKRRTDKALPYDGFQIIRDYTLLLSNMQLPYLEKMDLKNTLLLVPNKDTLKIVYTNN